MARPDVSDVLITDTFQTWLNKTNEIVDLVNNNILTASPGVGDSTTGNVILDGDFVAETVSADTMKMIGIEHPISAATEIESTSPLKIETTSDNVLTVKSTANRPIISTRNQSNLTWNIEHETALTTSSFIIKTVGAATAQLTLTKTGKLTVNRFEGDGSLITNINPNNITGGFISDDTIPNLDASKITSGVFDPLRIPDLDASKIASGTFPWARLPDSAKRVEITLANLIDETSSVQGFITGRRFREALVWENIDNKPATFAPDDHTHDGSDITTGTIDWQRIPGLPASRIQWGVLDISRIPDLDASKTTTGVFDVERIPVEAIVDEIEPFLFGNGQQWQDVKNSRSRWNSYQNTTGKPIEVCITVNDMSVFTPPDSYSWLFPGIYVSVDDVTWITIRQPIDSGTSPTIKRMNITFVVPDGHYYRVGNQGEMFTINSWVELR